MREKILRLTNGNCSPPVRRFGLQKTAVGAKRLCAVFLRHILRFLVLLRKPLFATAKRQLPRTLCAMRNGVTGGIGNGFVVAHR